MRLFEPAVMKLVAAAKGTGEDLFIGAVSRLSASDALSLSAELGESVLVLEPGFVLCPAIPDGIAVLNGPEDLKADADVKVYFADVRLCSDTDFVPFLKRREITEVLLPFSDCAVEGEYGFKGAYGGLCMLKADGLPLHLTAFTDLEPGAVDVTEAFGSKKCLRFCPGELAFIQTEKLSGEREQFAFLLSLCQKYVYRRTAVFFPTRRHAERFASFLRRSFTPFSLVHGGLPADFCTRELRRFLSYDTNILLATKHALTASPFVRADAVLCFGLPYSESHAKRLLSMGPENDLLCVYTDEDVNTLRRLIAATPDAMTLHTEQTVRYRSEAFEDFLRTHIPD